MNAHSSEEKKYRTNTQDLGWDEERAEFEQDRTNIGEGQRALSGLVGMGCMVAALSRRNWSGAALATVGIGLLHRAISGYCLAFGAMGIDMSGETRAGRFPRHESVRTTQSAYESGHQGSRSHRDQPPAA